MPPRGSKRGTGSIDKLPSGKWRLRYTDPTGKQVSAGTFPTKQLAERALTRIENSIAAGTYEQDLAIVQGDLDPKTVTLGQLAAHWRSVRVGRNGQPLRPSTANEYERIINNELRDFRDVPLRTITTQQLERWLANKRKIAPRMANAAYKHLNTVLTYAVKNKYLTRNPCDIDGATTYRPETEPDVPTAEQVAILIDNAPNPFNVMVALAAYAGLRKGELLELRRKDFSDVKRDGQAWVQLSVTRAVIYVDKVPVVGKPKTVAGIRSLLLPQAVNDLVKKYLRTIPISPDALLFARDSEHSKHWTEWRVNTLWKTLRPQAGYTGRFHSLRAYAQTQFGLTGATPREIMERFGTSDVITANRYQRTTGRETDLLRKMN